MPWLRRFIVICIACLAATAAGLALVVAFVDLQIGLHGTIALMLGVLLTMAIAMALMGLMFLSSRSGRDEHAHAAWRQRDGNDGDVR